LPDDVLPNRRPGTAARTLIELANAGETVTVASSST
jgi:hypothetical protein